MRALCVVALLIAPLAAHAQQDDQKTATGVIVATAGIGAAAATYAVAHTFLMLDDLMKQGYSDNSHTVPAGFLAGLSLLASTAWLIHGMRAGSELQTIGGSMTTLASATMTLLVAVAAHGWSIRQPAARL